MEKRLSNIFETTKFTKLTKSILKSYYRVLQVTNGRIKETCLFLRAAEFCPTFDIRISIALVIFWETFQNYTF